MTYSEKKKSEAEQHNKAYEESMKPKAPIKRSRMKTRKARQMLAVMIGASRCGY